MKSHENPTSVSEKLVFPFSASISPRQLDGVVTRMHQSSLANTNLLESHVGVVLVPSRARKYAVHSAVVTWILRVSETSHDSAGIHIVRAMWIRDILVLKN